MTEIKEKEEVQNTSVDKIWSYKKKFTHRKRFLNNIDANIPVEKAYSITSWPAYVESSVKKMELIAKMIRWEDIDKAFTILTNLPHKAAKLLLKQLKIAAANAKNNLWLNLTDLYIKRIDIGRWPKLKRIRYVARSRVHQYQKYRTFVRIVLDYK